MIPFRPAILSATLAFTVTASPGYADVSPQDVTQIWDRYLSTFGYRIDAVPETRGKDLIYPNFTLSIPVPSQTPGANVGDFRVSLGEVSLIDQGNGTVAVDLPETMAITVEGDVAQGGNFEAQMRLDLAGFSQIVSGSAQDMTFDAKAQSIALTLDKVLSAGQTISPDIGVFSIGDLTAQNKVSSTDGPLRTQQTLSATHMAFEFDAKPKDPNGPSQITMSGDFQAITMSNSGTIPADFDPLAMSEALKNGYDMSGTMAHSGGTLKMIVTEPGNSVDFYATSDGGSAEVALDQTGLRYDIAANGATLQITGESLPMPIAGSLQEADFALHVPVMKQEDTQEFSLTLNLTNLATPNFTIPDANGAPAENQLSLALDAGGKAMLRTDLFDAKAMGAMAATGLSIGEITEVSLNSLTIKAAEATIDGSGTFDVIKGARNPINPMLPALDGALDLHLNGVTTLISALSRASLLPVQIAVVADGAIRQFGIQGADPDDFKFKIDLSKDSGIKINDIPLPF